MPFNVGQSRNAVQITDLAPGAETTVAHGLSVTNLAQGDVLPDVLWVPGPDLEVTADAVNLTVRNKGGTPFTGSILCEYWDPITRNFDSSAVAPKPYIIVAAEGGNQPAQPPYPDDADLITVTIFARPGGDDANGDGSAANPYATFVRAIRDVPSFIPPGTVYRVDITGLDEQLPPNYEFPIILGAEGIGDFDFSQEFFHYFGVCNVQADPVLQDTIAAGTETVTHDPVSDLISVQVAPDPGWGADAFKGMLAVCPFSATRNSVIISNTSDTIVISRGETEPTFPLQIMDYGARLHAELHVDGPVHGTAINMRSTMVSLLGIKMEVDLGNAENPDDVNLCLSAMGDAGVMSFQGCHLQGAQFQTSRWSRIRQCYLPDFFSVGLPGLIVQSFLDGSAEPFGAGNGLLSLFPADKGGDFYLIESVLDGLTPLAVADSIEEFNPAQPSTFVARRCEILNTIADVVGNDMGIRVSGPNWTISGVKVDSAAGDGIRIIRGGFAQISNVGGAGNGGWGILMQDGTQAEFIDDPAGPHYPPNGGTVLNGTAVTGASGDLKVGDRGGAVWATLAAASPWNVIDVPAVNGADPPAGTDTGTLTRAYGSTK